MSKYDTLAQKIVNWGHQTENIRALIIIGSRARTSHPADEWSDSDLLVITTNMKGQHHDHKRNQNPHRPPYRQPHHH